MPDEFLSGLLWVASVVVSAEMRGRGDGAGECVFERVNHVRCLGWTSSLAGGGILVGSGSCMGMECHVGSSGR